MVGRWRPHLPEILGQAAPLERNRRFKPIFARSVSAVTPSEKNPINTNRKSTTRFPMSLRWSPYVAPKSPKGGSKTQIGRFWYKIALRLKKLCYKVSLHCSTFEFHFLKILPLLCLLTNSITYKLHFTHLSPYFSSCKFHYVTFTTKFHYLQFSHTVCLQIPLHANSPLHFTDVRWQW